MKEGGRWGKQPGEVTESRRDKQGLMLLSVRCCLVTDQNFYHCWCTAGLCLLQTAAATPLSNPLLLPPPLPHLLCGSQLRCQPPQLQQRCCVA